MLLRLQNGSVLRAMHMGFSNIYLGFEIACSKTGFTYWVVVEHDMKEPIINIRVRYKFHVQCKLSKPSRREVPTCTIVNFCGFRGRLDQ
jgi:hypothetical protein